MEQNYTPPVIDSNASHKQACNQFTEDLHKMLDRAALQKKVRYADRQDKSSFNNYIQQQGKIVKNRDQIYKITEMNIIEELTPLKEISTTDC